MSLGGLGPRAQLLLIAGLFVVPVAVAWLVVASGWRPGGGTNHGRLLDPPVLTDTGAWRGPEGAPAGPVLAGYWSLLVAAPEGCAELCLELLDRLRRVRLALNEDAARVQLLLAVPPGAALPELPAVQALTVPRDQLAGLAADTAGDATGLLVVDFRGYRMMTYPLPLDGEGLLEDLERLLRASSEDVENFERRRAAEQRAATTRTEPR